MDKDGDLTEGNSAPLASLRLHCGSVFVFLVLVSHARHAMLPDRSHHFASGSKSVNPFVTSEIRRRAAERVTWLKEMRNFPETTIEGVIELTTAGARNKIDQIR